MSLSLNNNTNARWWKDPGLRRLNLLLAGVMLGSIGSGYDASLINGLLSNNRWFQDMGISTSQLQGLVIASQSFGAIAALFPAAFITDKIGRRYASMLGNLALVGATLGQTFCTDAKSFLGTRLVLGFFNVVVIVGSSTLVAELSHPRQRAQVTASFGTFFYIGGITAAWASYGALSLSSAWSWRVPVILQMAWSIFQTIALVFCPESPRWLIAKNREEEARTTLAKYHANGDASDALVTFEFEEIKSSIEAERHASAYTWLTLFSTAGNIKRSFLIIFLGLSSQWVGNGIVSYYLAPILHNVGITLASQQQGINGGLQIFNWFVAIFGAYLAERVGRKRLLLISAGGMLISMILVTATSAVYHNRGEKSAGRAVIAFLFCFFGSYDIGFTPIPPLYVAEVASTHLRAKYTALYWMCTSVALCFNQYVNSIAFDAISWKYYLVYVGVLCVVIFVLAMYAPETKGRTLEEVGAIFDGGVADNLSRAEGLRIKAAEEEKADVAVQQTEYAGL